MSKFTPAFKAKVAIAAIKENEPIESLAKRYELSPSKITEWKDKFLKNTSQAFEKPSDSKRDLKKAKQENDRLLHKVGQLSIDCGFFCKSLRGSRTQSEIAELENLQAIYPQKGLSKGGKPKFLHSYLLRGLNIDHPNQVWSTDISYISMKGGFMYLYAIIDVYSRFIVGWRLSNTLSANNCYGLVEDCIKVYGAPEIINSDQGIQYTTKRWEDLLHDHNILISRTPVDVVKTIFG